MARLKVSGKCFWGDGEEDVEKSSDSLAKHLHILSLGWMLEARFITSTAMLF